VEPHQPRRVVVRMQPTAARRGLRCTEPRRTSPGRRPARSMRPCAEAQRKSGRGRRRAETADRRRAAKGVWRPEVTHGGGIEPGEHVSRPGCVCLGCACVCWLGACVRQLAECARLSWVFTTLVFFSSILTAT
jgi:hypothetical protein